MSKFQALFEDENDIFQGSPKSKFFDVTREASKEIVEEEIDKIIEKLAILEILASKNKDINFDINKLINEYKFSNEEEVIELKKSLYVEFTGEIISRLDS